MVQIGSCINRRKHARPTTGSAVLIATHVAQRRIERGQEIDLLVQRSRHDAQGSALAATRHADMLSVPLGQGHQKVDRAHTTGIDLFIIVLVHLLDVRVPIFAQLLLFRRNKGIRSIDRHAVNLHLERNESRLGISLRRTDALHTRTGRHEKYRMRLPIARQGQIAIHARAILEDRDAHHLHLELLGRVFGQGRTLHLKRCFASLLERLSPEDRKIERIGDRRFDLMSPKAHLHGLGVALPFDLEANRTIAEAGALHGGNLHTRLASAEATGTTHRRLHPIVAHLIVDRHPIQRIASGLGHHAHLGRMANGIEALRSIRQHRKINIGAAGLGRLRPHRGGQQQCRDPQQAAFHNQ